MELNGAHVLITGASRGIGAAMVTEFHKAGARVSLAARSTDAMQHVAEPVGGTVFSVDLADAAATEALIPRVEAESGPIDVLMSNAGVEESEHFHKVDLDTIRLLSRVNLEAPLVLTRQVLPGMLERNRGHLAYTSSLAGTAGFPGMATYGATKAGLMNFVAALRLELKDTNLHTTVVSPGPIDTAMWDSVTAANDTTPVVERLNRLRLLPVKSPEYLAQQTVDAVRNDRRHVRMPRRLSSNFWLREAPGRITELALKGVKLGPQAD